METENVKYADFVMTLAKPPQEIINSLTPDKAHLWHMATGIATEACELLEAVGNPHLSTEDRDNIVEEFGDLWFYLTGVMAQLNIETPPIIAKSSTGCGAHPTIKITDIAVICGKIVDDIKRHVIYERPNALDKIEERIGELGCLTQEVYETLRDFFGFDINSEIVETHNRNKLKARYKSLTYSNEQANARADKPAGE